MLHCDEFEVLLADHFDGLLNTTERAAEREAFLRHLDSCASCAALEADARAAVDFIAMSADVEPPPALAARILQATNSGWELKLRGKGIRGWINRTFAPVLRPRMVMGAMLTLMSLTMLTRCAGTPGRPITAADLDPVRLWSSLDDRVHRGWDRTVKSYESMRVVYMVRTQLNEWKQRQQEEEEAAADAKANASRIDLEPASEGKTPADAVNAGQEKRK